MPRIARVVAPGVPHHVTQRGNRKLQTFFIDEDYRAYIRLMAWWCKACSVEIWAYCLMPNHVHMIAVPAREDSFRRAIGEAHRLYTLRINGRNGWRGHLWQGRFFSYPMDEAHLLAAARYIELNPVRAGLTAKPESYPWSSAFAHLRGFDDQLVTVAPLLDMVVNWKTFIGTAIDGELTAGLKSHETTGRPLGDEAFIAFLEEKTGRNLREKQPGPKPGTWF